MAKTLTQETRFVFGPEQAEWKEAILAELESIHTENALQGSGRRVIQEATASRCVGISGATLFDASPRGRADARHHSLHA